MPKAKKTKRKAPVTLSIDAVPSEGGSKPTTTRTVIRRFHILIKRKTQLQKVLSEVNSNAADQDAAKKELLQALAKKRNLDKQLVRLLTRFRKLR